MTDYLYWLRDPLLVEVDRKLLFIIDQLNRQEIKIMSVLSESFDELVAQVAQTVAGQQSAIVAIQGIIARLDTATDPAQVRALSAQLKASTDALAAAIVAVPPPPQP